MHCRPRRGAGSQLHQIVANGAQCGTRSLDSISRLLATRQFTCGLTAFTTQLRQTAHPIFAAGFERIGLRFEQRDLTVETGEVRPFPIDDDRFGIATRRDLAFTVLAKPLLSPTP